MPTALDYETVGFYKKLRDLTAVPGVKPHCLNEDHRLYGNLRNELDLTLGTEGFRDEGAGDKFRSFFDYLKKTSPVGSSLEQTIDADFVTNRRILQQFAMHAYPSRGRVEIQAVRKNGVIFMSELEKEEEWSDPYPYGYKFEQYMTLDENGEPRDKYERVSNAECTKAVLRTTITSGNERFKALYTAEVDAIDADGNFCEMKTTTSTHAQWVSYKSLRTYLQALMGNVSQVVIGRKTKGQEHYIYEVEKLETDEIRQMGENNRFFRCSWNAEKCLEQMCAILRKIKSELQNDEDAMRIRLTDRGIFYEPENSDNCTFMYPDFLRHFD